MLKHMWIFDFPFFDRKSSQNLHERDFPNRPLLDPRSDLSGEEDFDEEEEER